MRTPFEVTCPLTCHYGQRYVAVSSFRSRCLSRKKNVYTQAKWTNESLDSLTGGRSFIIPGRAQWPAFLMLCQINEKKRGWGEKAWRRGKGGRSGTREMTSGRLAVWYQLNPVGPVWQQTIFPHTAHHHLHALFVEQTIAATFSPAISKFVRILHSDSRHI